MNTELTALASNSFSPRNISNAVVGGGIGIGVGIGIGRESEREKNARAGKKIRPCRGGEYKTNQSTQLGRQVRAGLSKQEYYSRVVARKQTSDFSGVVSMTM